MLASIPRPTRAQAIVRTVDESRSPAPVRRNVLAAAGSSMAAAMSVPILILVIGSEPQIRRLLRASFAAEGYRSIETRTAGEGLSAARARRPDLVLLDLDLPDRAGTALIRDLRDDWPHKPIIVLSARTREKNKVKALDLGADDYVTKPFSTGELMARVRVALRREALAGCGGSPPVLESGNLKLDLDRRLVFVGRRQVHLTPQEYSLLAYLLKHAGKVVTHPQLLTEVWGPEHTDNRAYLRVYMAQLRCKLEADPALPRYLLTEPGVGYRLKDR